MGVDEGNDQVMAGGCRNENGKLSNNYSSYGTYLQVTITVWCVQMKETLPRYIYSVHVSL